MTTREEDPLANRKPRDKKLKINPKYATPGVSHPVLQVSRVSFIYFKLNFFTIFFSFCSSPYLHRNSSTLRSTFFITNLERNLQVPKAHRNNPYNSNHNQLKHTLIYAFQHLLSPKPKKCRLPHLQQSRHPQITWFHLQEFHFHPHRLPRL